jgi:predicted CXXCH cytochrome family protein
MFTMGGVGSAQADTVTPIHKSTTVAAGTTQNITIAGSRCAGCHRAHTAKAEYLLKQAQPGLCYTCHGGAGSFLDVVDGVLPGTTSALRGGGFAYSLIDGTAGKMTVTTAGAKSSAALPGTVAAPVTSRHQIDGVTTGTMWGNGAISATEGGQGTPVDVATATNKAKAGDAGLYGVTLECGSCHDPHGNGNYRILKPVPSEAGKAQRIKTPAVPEVLADPSAVPPVVAAAFVPATYCTAEDPVSGPCHTVGYGTGYVVGGLIPVAIPDAVGTRVYTTADYWNVNDATVPNVPGALPGSTKTDGYIQNVAAWCTTCHTRYLAASGAWNTPNRGYVAGSTGVNGTGSNATTGTVDATFTYRHRSESAGTKASPNCIQCHVSHGTSATMTDAAFDSNNATLTAPDGTTPAAGTGTAGVGSLNNAGGIKGESVIGNSRLLRVNDRATCKMCHNV